MRNRLSGFENHWLLFDRLQRGFEAAESASQTVPVNVWAGDDEVTVAMEAPGFSRESLDVSLDGDLLSVTGRREEKADGEGERVLSERTVTEFSRSVRLPFEVDLSEMRATYDRGVLLITAPKAEVAKPTRIEVLAA